MGTEVAVFVTDFLLGGAAAFSKTATAPIERIKLLMQSQHEMIKSGVLDRPYSGLIDCFRRSVKVLLLFLLLVLFSLFCYFAFVLFYIIVCFLFVLLFFYYYKVREYCL